MPFNSNQNQTTLTTEHIEALANAIHAIRPQWHARSLNTLITRLAAEYDGRDLWRAAHAAAKDPSVRTPAGIEWRVEEWAPGSEDGGKSKTDRCTVCGKTEDRCQWERPKAAEPDDHVFLSAAAAKASKSAPRER